MTKFKGTLSWKIILSKSIARHSTISYTKSVKFGVQEEPLLSFVDAILH